MSLDENERVRVWNTFFKLARDEAAFVKQLQDPSWVTPERKLDGGLLDDKSIHSLAVIAWCCLALEARVSHLVEELKEQCVLSKDEAWAVHFLRTKEKWALLPKLSGKTTDVSFDHPPHQAISELCGLRNDLFHVNYNQLVEKLPSPRKAVSLFNHFVEAMEDMNVILGRHPEPDPNVLSITLK
jgi:hypothetical protein